MRIVEEEFSPEYESVPIRFSGQSFLDVADLRRGVFTEVSCAPFSKDYDQLWRPSVVAEFYPAIGWIALGAFEGETRVGGLLMAVDPASYDSDYMGPGDAFVIDIRVATPGLGVGRALVERAADVARRAECRVLKVETQNNNVAACRFYAAVGFTVEAVVEGAYDAYPDEAMVIWSRIL